MYPAVPIIRIANDSIIETIRCLFLFIAPPARRRIAIFNTRILLADNLQISITICNPEGTISDGGLIKHYVNFL